MNKTTNDLKNTIANVMQQVFKGTNLVNEEDIDTFADSVTNFVKSVSDISKDTFGFGIIGNDDEIGHVIFNNMQNETEKEDSEVNDAKNKKQMPLRDNKGRFIKSDIKKEETDKNSKSDTNNDTSSTNKKSIAEKLKERFFNKASKQELYNNVKNDIITKLEKFCDEYEYDERYKSLTYTYTNDELPDLFMLSRNELLNLRNDLINETGFSDVSLISSSTGPTPTENNIKICFIF